MPVVGEDLNWPWWLPLWLHALINRLLKPFRRALALTETGGVTLGHCYRIDVKEL